LINVYILLGPPQERCHAPSDTLAHDSIDDQHSWHTLAWPTSVMLQSKKATLPSPATLFHNTTRRLCAHPLNCTAARGGCHATGPSRVPLARWRHKTAGS
jgi:hypothetical protein